MKTLTLLVVALLALPAAYAGDHERLKNDSGERFIESNSHRGDELRSGGTYVDASGMGRRTGKGSREELKEEIQLRQQRRPSSTGVPIPSAQEPEPSSVRSAIGTTARVLKGAAQGAAQGSAWGFVGAGIGAVLGGIDAYLSTPDAR